MVGLCVFFSCFFCLRQLFYERGSSRPERRWATGCGGPCPGTRRGGASLALHSRIPPWEESLAPRSQRPPDSRGGGGGRRTAGRGGERAGQRPGRHGDGDGGGSGGVVSRGRGGLCQKRSRQRGNGLSRRGSKHTRATFRHVMFRTPPPRLFLLTYGSIDFSLCLQGRRARTTAGLPMQYEPTKK